MLAFFNCAGQDNHILDSLNSELAGTTTTEQKINTYLDFLDYTLEESKDSVGFFAIINQISNEKECNECIGISGTYVGHYYFSKGDYYSAIDAYKASATRMKQIDTTSYNSAVSWVAQTYILLNKYDKAKAIAYEIIKFNNGAKDYAIGTVTAYFMLGSINKSQNLYYSSIRNYLIADSISDNIDSSSSAYYIYKRIIYNNIGHLFRDLQNYPQAEKYFKKGLYVSEKSGRAKDVKEMELSFVMLLVDQKKYNKSIPILNKLVSYYSSENQDIIKLRESYLYAGKSYFGKNEIPRALINFKKALTICEEAKDSLEISILYRLIGDCEIESNQFELAEKYYLKSFEFAEMKKDKLVQIKALERLSSLYYITTL